MNCKHDTNKQTYMPIFAEVDKVYMCECGVLLTDIHGSTQKIVDYCQLQRIISQVIQLRIGSPIYQLGVEITDAIERVKKEYNV